MRTSIYEAHNLEDKNLPIIFHYDVIGKKSGMFPHWHDNIEILYCMAGSGKVVCNAVEHSLEKGDIGVINSNALHYMKTEDEFEYYCLIVDLRFLAANGVEADKMEFAGVLKDEEAAGIYECIVREMRSQQDYRVAGIRAEVLRLLVYLSRNHCVKLDEDVKSAHGPNENIKLAIGYIKANFAKKITLEDVADEVGLSKYYFARAFKKTTGMTFVTFVNTLRCRNAKKLLAGKQYSIREVARECGFENDSYFTKTYKSVMGCLPSER